MGSMWIVAPETDRYELTAAGIGDFWIVIKRELNVGEQKRLTTAGFRSMTGFGRQEPTAVGEPPRETELVIDWKQQTFVRTETYLVDWSLADDAGNKLAIRDTLQLLRQPAYDAIEAAINAHVARREKEKNVPAGAPPQSGT